MSTALAPREHCCCFTGHRPEKLSLPESTIVAGLRREIAQAIEDGYTTFVTGMARGVDIWAGEIIVALKEKGLQLTLETAIPYEGFHKHWDADWKERYGAVLRSADGIHFICGHYTKSCFQMRNQWMVDHVSLVIAAFTGDTGGTKNTVDYAKRCGIEVRNILLENP